MQSWIQIQFAARYSFSLLFTYARLAQSVEHQTFNLRVAGSSPSSGGEIFKNENFRKMGCLERFDDFS